MQYSAAQNIVPISKEPKLTPDEQPGDVQGTPEAPDKEPEAQDKEPEAQVEEPKEQKEEPSGVGEGDPEAKGEEKTEDKTETTDPRKGVEGGLDIANTTQQTLPPAYKIKIIFDAIKANGLGNYCFDMDIGFYVQGKLDRLTNNQPMKFCGSNLVQLKNAEATVEIPGESVESVKDYQPLSIFSAGSWLNNCKPNPLPTDLPEVRKALADKGSTRPYYAHVDEDIKKIQNQISNGCVPKDWVNPFNCIHIAGQYVCQSGTANKSLNGLNYVFESPGYGKIVPKDAIGNPERGQINTCLALPKAPYTTTGEFCLYFTIECSLCAAMRLHYPGGQTANPSP